MVGIPGSGVRNASGCGHTVPGLAVTRSCRFTTVGPRRMATGMAVIIGAITIGITRTQSSSTIRIRPDLVVLDHPVVAAQLAAGEGEPSVQPRAASVAPVRHLGRRTQLPAIRILAAARLTESPSHSDLSSVAEELLKFIVHNCRD